MIKIGLIGTDRFSNKMIHLLKQENFHCQQCLKIKNVPNIPIQFEAFQKHTCLVFTSVYGASLFKPLYLQLKADKKFPDDLKIAAIGPATKEELETYLTVDFMPEKYTTAGLELTLQSLKESCSNIVLFRSSEADTILDNNLSDFFNVKRYNLYHLDREIKKMEFYFSHLIFGSSYGVHSFFKIFHTIDPNIILCCLSDKTKQTLQKYCNNKILVSENATAEDLAEKLIKSLQK